MDTIREELYGIRNYIMGEGLAATVENLCQKPFVQKMLEERIGRIALVVFAGLTCVAGCVVGLAGFTAMLLPIDLMLLAPLPVSACATPFALAEICGLVAAIGTKVLSEMQTDSSDRGNLYRLSLAISTGVLFPILPGMILVRGGYLALSS